MFLPQKEETSKGSRPIHVMVWNVQRMGEYSGETNAVSQRIECVAHVIEKAKPDFLALLEISSYQLFALQTRLKISTTNCMWSDYYGTGQKHFGGLATCITGQNPSWAISRKRTLNLPPNWKYLFIEVQSQYDPSLSPVNFLALHITPPNLTETEVERTVSALFQRKQGALSQALRMLKEYESQVTLQGIQALSALHLIQKFQDPTIIAGDFNSTRDAALHVSLRKELIDTWSQAGLGFGATRYWGGFLPLRIDYIYVTKDFSVHNSQTISEDCSDHLPVVSSILLSPTRPLM
jgi:exonuclease III